MYAILVYYLSTDSWMYNNQIKQNSSKNMDTKFKIKLL
jgi:hypothetical protein